MGVLDSFCGAFCASIFIGGTHLIWDQVKEEYVKFADTFKDSGNVLVKNCQVCFVLFF